MCEGFHAQEEIKCLEGVFIREYEAICRGIFKINFIKVVKKFR